MRLFGQAAGVAVGSVLVFWVLQAILSRWLNFQFTTEPLSTFLEIYGTLYGITFAFTLYVVWSQFNSVQNGVKQEADVLEDIYRMTFLLSDRISAQSLAQNLREYVEAVLGSEWLNLSQGKDCPFTHDKFVTLCQSLRTVPVVDARDQTVFGQMLEAVNRLTRIREERLTSSLTRIPNTLWDLLVFMSVALLFGFILLALPDSSNPGVFVGTLIIALVGGSIGLLLGIVKDMDNPFVGIWNVSAQPFRVLSDKMH
ncbi:MAG: DUF4239 domain-containing protein [Armatimonadetes bacterium]|nr:DUF4239 domain-containing protein [Armatimonadota bacterium]MCX7967873.1 DUF4239 domain-containing protein [Armatimonadota bacterium]MDW8142482.1 DUF4239 domain-containing protein [Armatimonadota bacterium]